ncbi:MAG: 16S rRNA (adenine(1518)-N(6)/adenine(1519)-N(6))-dimethyltransferase RsmA [Gemmatimonadaceae bacterium]
MVDPDGRNARATYPRPRKSLGQHFLSDPRILGRIADGLELTGRETVLEIGPGRGGLTDILASRAGRVLAIELDRMLAEQLRRRYAGSERVTVIEADVLAVDLGALGGSEYVLVGNVPYYITTPILFHAMRPPRPRRAVYLVQREVAERLVAQPGTGEYGALTVNVAAFARVELLFRVPAGAFRPPPKVESAVVRVTPLDAPLLPMGDEERFRKLVQGAFAFRRKQMRRVVRSLASVDAGVADTILANALVAPDVRPETLTPMQFAELLRALDAERARGAV